MSAAEILPSFEFGKGFLVHNLYFLCDSSPLSWCSCLGGCGSSHLFFFVAATAGAYVKKWGEEKTVPIFPWKEGQAFPKQSGITGIFWLRAM